MTAYGARGLPIRVYRLIRTFRAYGDLSRLSCVLLVRAKLMGAWLGCCFIIFDKFRFTVGWYTYVIFDLFIGLFKYIKIFSHSLLPFILCTLFLTDIDV